MTFSVHTYYCKRCKTGTPHELSEDGQHASCTICDAKQQKLLHEVETWNDTTRFISALDGMGNRGEPPPRLPPIMRHEPADTAREENKK